VIKLYHFLPLQTALVASYSRLYAVTLGYIEEEKSGDVPTPSGIDIGDDDLGQALSRDIPVPDTLPPNETPHPMTKATKAKRKDAMDDIFG
jgi:hypothetical protein